jgi:hypothetical protein
MMLGDIIAGGPENWNERSTRRHYFSFNAMQTDHPIAWVTLFKQLANDGRKPKDEATAALG